MLARLESCDDGVDNTHDRDDAHAGVARTLFEFSCREAFLMLLKADEPHGIGMM